ncbi:GDSL esterase/lipase At1g29670-like isoform X2 [Cajanus cajan]|uniref:GDSL esterase/lipase At1g29670-like isoform X2 n=1 Tax=Cajanus cajan TaxID=3821 RepID=UPI00098D8A94|nr:GDSL esterase/lipase At1g29670-like isoform X2 [Cajanus cajan]
MEAKTKPLLVVSLLLLAANCVHGESHVPCVFIFGDSLSDNGNNNNLPTYAKSNYRPYGINFPNGPTGRFTNGLTTIDFTTQLLGFEKFIPPFANTSGSDILKGANYASGAAGILFESGKHMGENIHLGAQLINHRVIYSRIAMRLGGSEKAEQYLNKCLYYMNIGSNDYINNYFLPNFYPASRIYTPLQFANLLIDQYSGHIQSLREVGARKMVIVGLGLMGCTPNAFGRYKTNGTCFEGLNDAAFMFNNKLNSLVDQLNTNFSADSKFIFINSTAGSLDSSLGFTVVDAPCCPSGENGQCIPNETPCQNSTAYVFWDEFHTTQAVNRYTAIGLYNNIKFLFQA